MNHLMYIYPLNSRWHTKLYLLYLAAAVHAELCQSYPADGQFLVWFPVLSAVPLLSHGNMLTVPQSDSDSNTGNVQSDRITITADDEGGGCGSIGKEGHPQPQGWWFDPCSSRPHGKMSWSPKIIKLIAFNHFVLMCRNVYITGKCVG